jgi:CheY-like chemotaxis protein
MRKRILIVDDDRQLLGLIATGLARYKETFAVVVAENGAVALEKLKQNAFSLMVSDVKMPQVNGFSLVAQVMENYPELPVIFMTGQVTPELRKIAPHGNVIGWMEKPFALEALGRKILNALQSESDGGMLHGVSSGMFLQLIEVEQKTCTIRLVDKVSGKRGILLFRSGVLFDARTDDLQGQPAAYEILSWEEVTLSIQNDCPRIKNRIGSDLQSLLLEAMRLKDESPGGQETRAPRHATRNGGEESGPRRNDSPPGDGIRCRLEESIGARCGLEGIGRDDSWETLLHSARIVGEALSLGGLRLGYIDKGAASDFILLADKRQTVLTMSPKCPRDRIIQLLCEQANEKSF